MPSVVKINKETELKFLLLENGVQFITNEFYIIFKSLISLKNLIQKDGFILKQGYLKLHLKEEICNRLGITIDFHINEIRLREKNKQCYITFKSAGGLTRNELEFEIDKSFFKKYWKLTKGNRIKKIRLNYPYSDLSFEIDLYTDRKLIVAEIELPSAELVKLIPVIGKDITTSTEYKNCNLAK